MKLEPLTRDQSQAFIREHHRHAVAQTGDRFRVGLTVDGELVGVAVAGRPKARALDDGYTVEITRVATDGIRNGCSKLYAALLRAAWALGFRRAITYTLVTEPGSSLRAVGFQPVGEPKARQGWSAPSRPRDDSGRQLRDISRQRWEITNPTERQNP